MPPLALRQFVTRLLWSFVAAFLVTSTVPPSQEPPAPFADLLEAAQVDGERDPARISAVSLANAPDRFNPNFAWRPLGHEDSSLGADSRAGLLLFTEPSLRFDSFSHPLLVEPQRPHLWLITVTPKMSLNGGSPRGPPTDIVS